MLHRPVNAVDRKDETIITSDMKREENLKNPSFEPKIKI